jgi:hypothetical protein
LRCAPRAASYGRPHRRSPESAGVCYVAGLVAGAAPRQQDRRAGVEALGGGWRDGWDGLRLGVGGLDAGRADLEFVDIVLSGATTRPILHVQRTYGTLKRSQMRGTLHVMSLECGFTVSFILTNLVQGESKLT